MIMYLVALILVLGWAIGMLLDAGGLIHILLIIAIITFILALFED